MMRMETITLILATAAITALLTWFFTARRQALSPTYGPLAPAWREGYRAGVADERYAEEVNFTTEYGRVGPNRANPYRGSEKGSDA
jgi:hypothetical protein